jgi:long-chain acyl-CoA synthetase
MYQQRPWLKHYDPGVPTSIPYPPEPLYRLLENAADEYGGNPAISFYGLLLTYSELDRLANRFANGLRRFGIQQGDRIALLLPNLPQVLIAYYGALKIGAIAVLASPLYLEAELEHQLQDCSPRGLVSLDSLYPRVEAVRQRLSLEWTLITSVQDYLPAPLTWLYPLQELIEGRRVRLRLIPPLYRWQEWLDQQEETRPEAQVGPGDPAMIQYTGGTTGVAKGAVLTHANLVANTLQCRYWARGYEPGKEVMLGALPFFHVYGMTVAMNLSVALAALDVLVPRFKTKEILQLIQKHRVTSFPGVQLMYQAINRYPKTSSYDLSSIKVCISGAGPLRAEVQKEFESHMSGKLVEGYGLSEASPVTHCNPLQGVRVEGSIGLPFPDVEARIVDPETGKIDLPVGQAGELVVRGPQVMRGFWNRPEETRAVLRDGWLLTGDIALMDKMGFFFVVDRKKDLIKSRGENIFPSDVEDALLRCPAVQDAVVVGLPDTVLGERIKAFVVLAPGAETSPAELLESCSQRLPRYAVPGEIEFRKELPKGLIGKVLRRVLREEEASKQPV